MLINVYIHAQTICLEAYAHLNKYNNTKNLIRICLDIYCGPILIQKKKKRKRKRDNGEWVFLALLHQAIKSWEKRECKKFLSLGM